MVKGLEHFRKHFSEFAESYVLIGGTASALAMDEFGAEFRVTKDLDIVLCVEALDHAFVEEFWRFIQIGGYENRQQSTGKRLYYRFYSPKRVEFPAMLELFSKKPDALQLLHGCYLTPIPIGEAISSLSAILLNDGYYHLIHQCKRVVQGLPIIGAECLIPLKARAYLDLTERKAAGERVDSADIKKHKNDLIRLFSILEPESKPTLPNEIKDDLKKVLTILATENANLKSLGVNGLTLPQLVAELAGYYELGG